MAWNAIIDTVQFNPNDGRGVVRVVWVNETEGQKTVKDYQLTNPTVDGFLAMLRAEQASLESVTPFLKAVQPGPVDLTPPPPPPPPDPTPLQLFLTAYNAYASALRKVTAGVVSNDAKEVTVLHDAAVAAYDPAFAGIG